MNFLNWLLGFTSDADKAGKHMIAGIERLATIFHEAADRLEGRAEAPKIDGDVLAITESTKKHSPRAKRS